MILSCNKCTHAYQDKKHGLNNRVHNPSPQATGPPSWKCTICGAIRNAGKEVVGKTKKGKK